MHHNNKYIKVKAVLIFIITLYLTEIWLICPKNVRKSVQNELGKQKNITFMKTTLQTRKIKYIFKYPN